MGFNLATINSRLQRLVDYIHDPELRKIISDGVSEMDPKDIRNVDVHRGLEEGTWAINLLRWVTDETNNSPKKFTAIREYIEAFSALEKREQWGEWEVDSANNEWAPIWVRLVDKLRVAIATHGYILPKEDDAKIAEVYARYKGVKHGVDARREKHDQIDKEYAIIFADDKEVGEAATQPFTNQVTPKHCFKLLLEIEDTAKREDFINRYFKAITANCNVPLAKKLADYCPKAISNYSEEYIGKAPEGDANLVQIGMETFNKAFNAALAK